MPEPLLFFGEEFQSVEQFPQMALLEFAHIANGGVDSNDFAGLAAMYELLEAAIEPSDWARFKKCAKVNKAQGEDLLNVVGEVISRTARRPTSRPSDSSDGPSTTAHNSTSTPAERAIEQLNGRPELQLLVMQAQEERAS